MWLLSWTLTLRRPSAVGGALWIAANYIVSLTGTSLQVDNVANLSLVMLLS